MPLEKNTVMIDANVILRYLLKDNDFLYKKSEALFDDIFTGRKKALVIHPVIAEVVYVLQKLYKVSKEEIAEVLTEFLKMKGIKTHDEGTVFESFEIFKNRNMDYVDCLLCAYGKEYKVVSFDRDLKKCLRK